MRSLSRYKRKERSLLHCLSNWILLAVWTVGSNKDESSMFEFSSSFN